MSPPPELLMVGALESIGVAVVLIAGMSVVDIVGVGIGIGIMVAVVIVMVAVGIDVIVMVAVGIVPVVIVIVAVTELEGSVVTAPPMPSVSSFFSPQALIAKAHRPRAALRSGARKRPARFDANAGAHETDDDEKRRAKPDMHTV